MAPSFLQAKECGNRLSDLPDSIIHHIFSFLEMNDFVRVAFLSERFQKLCLSNPYIYLTSQREFLHRCGPTKVHKLVNRHVNDSPRYNHDPSKSRCRDFVRFLNKYMSQRSDNFIQSFHLEFFTADGSFRKKQKDMLDVWLCQAAKCMVQELYLHINSGYFKRDSVPYSLPQDLISPNCLRVLELDLHHNKFKLPSAVMVSLEILSIECSGYSGEIPIGEWISTHCPSLKKLGLVSVEVLNLGIRSVTELTIVLAKRFTQVLVSCVNLQALSLYLSDNGNKDGHLQVSAPNLQVFKWGGSPYGDINLGAFPFLNDATFYRCTGDYAAEVCLDGLFSLVKVVTSAKVLRIPLTITEAMFIKQQELVLFENLEHLVIEYQSSDLKDYHSAVIADFVRRSPNLTSLVIENKNKCSGSWKDEVEKLIEKKARDHDQGCEKIGQQVKELKIKLIDKEEEKNKGMMELLKHYVKTADGLEKMTIFYPLSCFDQLFLLFDKIGDSSRVTNIVTRCFY